MLKSPSTKRATDAEIYRKAARDIELEDSPVPLAIKRYTGVPLMVDCELVGKLKVAFMEEPPYWPWTFEGKERRNLRILALCFMAAMVEAGDA